ncbi:MAG: hypothetical protein WCI60_02545 [bacterium]
MFGQNNQDNPVAPTNNAINAVPAATIPSAAIPTIMATAVPTPSIIEPPTAPVVAEAPTQITYGSPPAPTIDNPSRPFLSLDNSTPAETPNEIQATISSVAPSLTPEAGPVDSNLLAIKQEALEKLSPLVGQLEQSASEKFHTTMMMIQASDNQSLVQSAYDAAQQIPDEKERAQALLDVVNEINYFTQK